MADVFVNAFDVKIVIVGTQRLKGLHAEHLLEHSLSSVEENVLILVTEIQGLGQDAKELRLKEANAQPPVHDKLIQYPVKFLLLHFLVFARYRIAKNFDERTNGRGDLAN